MGIRDSISHTSTLLSGAIVGAAAMYILDPQQGNRRRAQAREKAMHGGHLLLRAARRRAKHLVNRGYGQMAELVSGLRDRNSEIDDDTLVRRVRAQLGHAVAHPGSLEITAKDGCVRVFGPVLNREVPRMEERLRKTRGVRSFELRVDRYESPADIPGLQGQPRMPRRQTA